eukprot:m.154172 g.154172  ORF g.154172 m.154172 type:complete len:195 (-) comp30874_c0_seq1:352-936(-)
MAEQEQNEGPMVLTYGYSLWFSHIDRGSMQRQRGAFEDTVKQLGTFNDVDGFWKYFSHLAPAGDLPSVSDYHLFKTGIKPMWEDTANTLGGKWIVRLRKGLASRYWEKLVISIIGDQFDVGNEICGAVISIRYHEDIISVWNRSAHRADAVLKIKETLKRVLSLPTTCALEYKTHDTSLKDKSSFRNTSTDVFR